MSAFVVACGKDESGGDDDDDGDTTNTTGTPTTNTTSNPTNTATSGNPTNTATSNGGSSSTTASQGGSGGTGATTSVGGSAGGGGDMGGSAGAPEGGAGGGTTNGGSVVVEDDCSYEPCGGDLANTDWDYSRICVEKEALLAPFQEFCPTIEVLSAGGEVTGSIGFEDDSFIQDVTFSVSGEFDVPAECIVLSCGVVGLGLAAAGLTDASCVDSDSGCLCSGTMLGQSGLEGDYSTDAETLSLEGEESSYCASDASFKYTGEIQGVEFVYETVPQ